MSINYDNAKLSDSNALFNANSDTINHDVELVGWDDSFDREKFALHTGEEERPDCEEWGELGEPVEIDASEGDSILRGFTPQEDGAYELSASVDAGGNAKPSVALSYYDVVDK